MIQVLLQSTSDQNDGGGDGDGAQRRCAAHVMLLVWRTFPQFFVGVVLNEFSTDTVSGPLDQLNYNYSQ